MHKIYSLLLLPAAIFCSTAAHDSKTFVPYSSYAPGQTITIVEQHGMGFIAAKDNCEGTDYVVDTYNEYVCSKTGDKKRTIRASRDGYTLLPGFPLYRHSIILEETRDANNNIKTGAGAPGGPGGGPNAPFVINVHSHSGNAIITAVFVAGLTGIVYKLCKGVQDLRLKYAQLETK